MSESANGPVDPLTPAAQNAAGIHEMYESYVAAGFLPLQACVVLGIQLGIITAFGASS